MASLVFYNRAFTTLAGAITSTATTANLAAGAGAMFVPVISGGNYFKMTFIDAATGLLNEIVHVTGLSGDTITSMIRGQEGTDPKNWLAGDLAQNLWTAGSASLMIQNIQFNPVRTIATSGVFVMDSTDGTVALARVSSPAASSTVLPSDAAVGQIFTICDIVGNAQAYPITVQAPPGTNINNLAQVVLNVNRQSVQFQRLAGNAWNSTIV